MSQLRKITCDRCGAEVRIPLFWVLGIEGIFYCRACRQHFKIDYKLGALLAGLGWATAWAAMQLIACFTTAVTLTLAVLAFLPLGGFFSFAMRRAMLWGKIRRRNQK
ncbi:MAG: hypothetical protein LBU80_02405 [Rikenellaceae bacterium]|jgi:hypothetical protein|nr:hypothetical protein [Rikenellaceae bacterium]